MQHFPLHPLRWFSQLGWVIGIDIICISRGGNWGPAQLTHLPGSLRTRTGIHIPSPVVTKLVLLPLPLCTSLSATQSRQAEGGVGAKGNRAWIVSHHQSSTRHYLLHSSSTEKTADPSFLCGKILSQFNLGYNLISTLKSPLSILRYHSCLAIVCLSPW